MGFEEGVTFWSGRCWFSRVGRSEGSFVWSVRCCHGNREVQQNSEKGSPSNEMLAINDLDNITHMKIGGT